MKKMQLMIKRFADIFVSIIALLVLSPAFLLIAILIKMTSKGPVFFRQERLGKGGKTFQILKFRTMVVNAEHLGEGLRVSSERDPRITAIGRILRATSLDELPNLVNTFLGDMSLVGPRPPVTYHPYPGYGNYPEWAKKRFEMRPGITGLAQVTVRNSASWNERIKIDNQYIQNFNIALDIRVLFLTVKKVLKSENIYGAQAADSYHKNEAVEK